MYNLFMRKLRNYFLIFSSIAFLIFFFFYLRKQNSEDEVIRKLSGLRLSLLLYKMKYKDFPAEFENVIKAGYLEDVPEIKLKWKFKSKKVNQYDSLKFNNTGTWAYINNPLDKNFGLIYIDSIEKDTKGRYWSCF